MAEGTDPVAEGIVAGSPGNAEPSGGENQSGGSNGSDWRNGFDDDLKKRTERFKTPSDMAKSYVEMEKMSSKSVQDMSPEEIDKLYKRLGRPEKPDEYELSNVAMPEGVARQDGADDGLKKFAHSIGMTKAQLKQLHEWSMKRAGDSIIAARQSAAKDRDRKETDLRTNWSADYDNNNAKVNALVARFGGDEAVAYMNNGPGKDPELRKFLFNIAKTMSDETFVGGSVTPMNRVAGDGNMVVDFGKSPEISGSNRYGRR